MKRKKVLLIEDNADTRKFLEITLQKDYDVILAENAVIGIDFARLKQPDLILLDIMLPILNGFDACQLLKKDPKTENIPVIFLSAKDTPHDVLEGFGLGAEDYVTKPFDHDILKARIEKRIQKKEALPEATIKVGDLVLDSVERIAQYKALKFDLTYTEFDLLKFLALHAGDPVTRSDILREVWKNDAEKANDRTIDVHIRALRKKAPILSRHILSIYGVGYKYEP